MLKRFISILSACAMLCALSVPVTFADNSEALEITQTDVFTDNVVTDDYVFGTTNADLVSATRDEQDEKTWIFKIKNNPSAACQWRYGNNNSIGTWKRTGLIEVTFDYQYTGGTLPEGGSYTHNAIFYSGDWFAGGEYTLINDGNLHNVKAIVEFGDFGLNSNGDKLCSSLKLYDCIAGEGFSDTPALTAKSAGDDKSVGIGYKIVKPYVSTDDNAQVEMMRISNARVVEKTAPTVKSIAGVYASCDDVPVDMYVPENTTEASIKVGNKTYPLNLTSKGSLRANVPLEGCAGTNVPVVLKYTVAGVEDSASAVIEQVIDGGYRKIVGNTGFEDSKINESDGFYYSDNFKHQLGAFGTDSILSIAESPAGNMAWKCQLNTIDGKGQTNIICFPALVDGYYADIDFDFYAEKQNYRLLAFLKGISAWPEEGGWLEHTPKMSDGVWHKVKYRVYPDKNIIYVYADGVYVNSIAVHMSGFSQIGVGLRNHYATSAAEPVPGAVYIDNLKVTSGIPKYKNFNAVMDTENKTVTASFVGGSDAQERDLGKLIVAAYDNEGKLVGCKAQPITATENTFDTYTLENTFEDTFVSAKAFLWSNDGTMTPLVDAINATVQTVTE